jgi:hypothetical protein
MARREVNISIARDETWNTLFGDDALGRTTGGSHQQLTDDNFPFVV